MSVAVKGLSIWAKDRNPLRRLWSKAPSSQQILNDVSCVVKPGQLLAILGSSGSSLTCACVVACACGGVCGATDNATGSGKTTLLNSLAGRMQAEGWTRYLTPRPTDIVADGDVLFNGVPKTPKEIRRIAAYVMQKVRSTWAYLTSRAACVVACTRSHFSSTCVLRNHCRTTFCRTSPFAKPSPTPASSPFPPACRS